MRPLVALPLLLMIAMPSATAQQIRKRVPDQAGPQVREPGRKRLRPKSEARLRGDDRDDRRRRHRKPRHRRYPFVSPWRPGWRPYAGPIYRHPGIYPYPLPSYGIPAHPRPIYPGYRPGGIGYPQSVLIESNVIPGPPLPPARVKLFHSSPRPLQVTVIDLAEPAGTESVRLDPGGRKTVSLQSDSGAQLVRRYATYDAFGLPVTRSVTIPIPPESRYEVVVHEWAVQSVAIDRTGKSPDPIEDINMQGRGIGRFRLPPANQVRGATIDVFERARAADNPGSVAPVVPSDHQSGAADNPSRLERAIREVRQRQRAAEATGGDPQP